MARFIDSDYTWYPIRPDSYCKNWVDGRSAQVRMTNHVSAVAALVRAANHCLGQMPRVVFTKAQTFTNALVSGTQDRNPLYEWIFPEEVKNADVTMWQVLAIPREDYPTPPTDAIWQRYEESGGSMVPDSDTTGPNHEGILGLTAEPEDASMEAGAYVRAGAESNADVREGVGTNGNHNIWDICVQDHPRSRLYDDDHDSVSDAPMRATPILGGDDQIVHLINDRFWRLRRTNLPIVASWAAMTQDGGGYLTTGITLTVASEWGGGRHGTRFNGISSTVADMRNMLDGSTTGASTRSATAAGWPMFLTNMGMGTNYEQSSGNLTQSTVPVEVQVLAQVIGGNTDAQFRAVGSHNGGVGISGAIDYTVGSPAWYQMSGPTYMSMDTFVEHDDTSTRRGLLQIYGGNNGGTGDLYIYGVRAWILPDFT